MKKITVITVLLAAIAIGFAQSTTGQSKARLNVYGSYVFHDGFEVYDDINNYFDGTVKGGLQWGGGLEYLVHPDFSVELLCLNKSSDVPTTFKFGTEALKTEEFKQNLNFLVLGFNRLQRSSDGKIEGYGGLMAGV